MTQLTATFKVVTPLFLAGADQTKAELRAPSIKAAMRFWYRAIDPQYCRTKADEICVRKDEPAKDTPTREEAIFGSARCGQSQFSLRIVPPAAVNGEKLKKKTHTSR